MKSVYKVISLILIIVIIVCIAGCGKTAPVNSAGSENDKTQAEEELFVWYADTISSLTDEGKKQKEIVIPDECHELESTIFASKEAVTEKVSFESDADIDLNGAFKSSATLKTIVLPANLTKIGDMEFSFCLALDSITLPDKIKKINTFAFQEDTALKKVETGNNITAICEHAFDGCTALTNITLPESLTDIGDSAFYNCKSLKKITIPTSVKTIGKLAFANTGITDLTVAENAKFENCSSQAFLEYTHNVNVHVKKNSWIDKNFEDVFTSEIFIKTYS